MFRKIVNDVTSGLTKKKRPGSRREKFVYFSEILSALGRLEKLRKIPQVNTTELHTCLYSMSTITHFIALLPETEFDDFNRKMTENNMDFRNPCGEKTYLLFKKVCEIEQNAMEAYKGVRINPNPKQSTPHRRIIALAQMKNKNLGSTTQPGAILIRNHGILHQTDVQMRSKNQGSTTQPGAILAQNHGILHQT